MNKEEILSKLLSLDSYISPEETKYIDDNLCHLDYSIINKDDIKIIDDYLSCRIVSLNAEGVNGEEIDRLITISDLLRENYLT